MNITTIINNLDRYLKVNIQEEYDNSGRQIIFHDKEVTSILLSLDIDSSVVDEALDRNCDLIITHHPLFFKPLRHIGTYDAKSSLVVKLIDKRINVYSAHTNLDKLLYDKLARTIGFTDIEIMYPEPGMDAGMGALASLEKPVGLNEMLARVKKALDLDYIHYSGDAGKKIKRVALMNGAGGGSIEKIISQFDPDCIITGDVGYHHAKYASDSGVAVLDAGHFGTEIIMIGFLRDLVIDCLTNYGTAEDIPLCISEREKNPFRLYGTGNE
ncbi:MAG: Nif3-like dinuclear metal center hexameric protein [Spirochaetes bacterium]|nr:Nif3-like dinuclear metal center hexameric protein [Spirochaetota bacterium]